jgi:hypothetical protein
MTGWVYKITKSDNQQVVYVGSTFGKYFSYRKCGHTKPSTFTNGKQQNLFRLRDFHGSLLFSFSDASLKTDNYPKQLSIPYVYIKDSDIIKIQGKNILAEYTPNVPSTEPPTRAPTQAPTQAPTLPFSFGFQNTMPFSFGFQNMMFQSLSVNDQINTIKPCPLFS